uniref:Lipase domain-containing protein n=1 Tax=Tetranychus urticae TaxID=32264 RepID=T1KA87_TETUR
MDPNKTSLYEAAQIVIIKHKRLFPAITRFRVAANYTISNNLPMLKIGLLYQIQLLKARYQYLDGVSLPLYMQLSSTRYQTSSCKFLTQLIHFLIKWCLQVTTNYVYGQFSENRAVFGPMSLKAIEPKFKLEFNENEWTGVKHAEEYIQIQKCNYKLINKLFLDYKPNRYNIFALDWRKEANPKLLNYFKAKANVAVVGSALADFIIRLVNFTNIKYSDKISNPKIARIIGLDAAGPGFRETNESLGVSDAHYVENVHTDAAAKPIATIIYYPNGGYGHDGCNAENAERVGMTQGASGNLKSRLNLCASIDAHHVWGIARVLQFVGIACASYEHFLQGYCDCAYKCAILSLFGSSDPEILYHYHVAVNFVDDNEFDKDMVVEVHGDNQIIEFTLRAKSPTYLITSVTALGYVLKAVLRSNEPNEPKNDNELLERLRALGASDLTTITILVQNAIDLARPAIYSLFNKTIKLKPYLTLVFFRDSEESLSDSKFQKVIDQTLSNLSESSLSAIGYCNESELADIKLLINDSSGLTPAQIIALPEIYCHNLKLAILVLAHAIQELTVDALQPSKLEMPNDNKLLDIQLVLNVIDDLSFDQNLLKGLNYQRVDWPNEDLVYIKTFHMTSIHPVITDWYYLQQTSSFSNSELDETRWL